VGSVLQSFLKIGVTVAPFHGLGNWPVFRDFCKIEPKNIGCKRPVTIWMDPLKVKSLVHNIWTPWNILSPIWIVLKQLSVWFEMGSKYFSQNNWSPPPSILHLILQVTWYALEYFAQIPRRNQPTTAVS